jgi:predicted nucleic acid-binding Zn ribbon protein
MPTNGPVRLGDVLEEVIDQLGVRPKINEARVVEAWHTRAGPKIEEVTTSAWMKGATLFVKISSAAWRQELHMNRRTWARRLNDELGQEIVDEIVFR